MKLTHKGLSIVELLAILVILAIIALIAVPNINRLIENTRRRADLADVTMLNEITRLYQLGQLGYPKVDVFEGLTTDQQRQEHLVAQGFLTRVITPRIAGERFEWVIEEQVWIYTGLARADIIVTPIVFTQTPLSEARRSPSLSFSAVDDGWRGSFGLVYFDNPRSVYTITVVAALDPGTGGGYGILVEAALNEVNADINSFNDTGHIVQFDRGLSDIVIRPRVNGVEQNRLQPNTTAGQRLTYFTDVSLKSSDWWTTRHTVVLDVTQRNAAQAANEKLLTVYISGEKILEWEFTSQVATAQNFTGLRSWGSPTTFESITITP